MDRNPFDQPIPSNYVYMDATSSMTYLTMLRYRWRVQEFTRKMNPEQLGSEIEDIAVEADRFIQSKHHSTTVAPTVTTAEHNGYVTVFIMYLESYTPDEPANGGGSYTVTAEPSGPHYRYVASDETQALSQALRAHGAPAVRPGSEGTAD